jgi:hypothetical protein
LKEQVLQVFKVLLVPKVKLVLPVPRDLKVHKAFLVLPDL